MLENDSSRTKFDVVIVNWNGGQLILDCLCSLRHGQAFWKNFDIFVVDNNSSDGSDVAIEQLANTTLIRNDRNVGFGRACNQGARTGKSEIVVFLNPDTEVEKDTFSKLEVFFSDPDNAEISVCGVELKDNAQNVSRSCARYPGFISYFFRATGLDHLPMFYSKSMIMKDWDHLSSREVDHVIGAFYAVRRSTFEQVGGFDENYFVYLEDLDLSRQITLAGGKVFYNSNISAQHLGGGLSKRAKGLRTFLSARSGLIYAKKHFDTLRFLSVVPLVLILEPLVRIFAAVFSNKLTIAEELEATKLLWRWILFHQSDQRWMP
jgi:GT2 family glycosyltransferase